MFHNNKFLIKCWKYRPEQHLAALKVGHLEAFSKKEFNYYLNWGIKLAPPLATAEILKFEQDRWNAVDKKFDDSRTDKPSIVESAILIIFALPGTYLHQCSADLDSRAIQLAIIVLDSASLAIAEFEQRLHLFECDSYNHGPVLTDVATCTCLPDLPSLPLSECIL